MYNIKTQEYSLVEVNGSPSLMLHHQPSLGKPIMAADILIAKLLKHYDTDLYVQIGVSAFVDFVGYKNLKKIPARIDTGAQTSSLWASDVKVKNGIATFKLFGPSSPWYTGKVVRSGVLEQRSVISSTGHIQKRHLVEMFVNMHGMHIKTRFTLSDRSSQTYPVLIGRNTLRGNFLVDSGNPGEAPLYKYPEQVNEFKESETV